MEAKKIMIKDWVEDIVKEIKLIYNFKAKN